MKAGYFVAIYKIRKKGNVSELIMLLILWNYKGLCHAEGCLTADYCLYQDDFDGPLIK